MKIAEGGRISLNACGASERQGQEAGSEKAAANEKSADHCCVYAAILAARDGAGPLLARAVGRTRMKLAASELQRPAVHPTAPHRATRWLYLDPPLILSGRVEVEISDQDVARNGSTNLPADASGCSLEWSATRPQHA